MRQLLLMLAFAVLAAVSVTASNAPDNSSKTYAEKVASLTRLRREVAAKKWLGRLRAEVVTYFGDTEGNWPTNLSVLVPKYIETIPALELPEHLRTNKVVIVTKAKGKSPEPYLKDTGGWLYFSGPGTGDMEGNVVIDCNHKSENGLPMSGF